MPITPEQFKDNIVEFIDMLIEYFPGDHDLIVARLGLKVTSAQKIIDLFCTHIVPNSQTIKDRDMRKLLDDAEKQVSDSSKIDKIRSIWFGSIPSDDDFQVMWEWIDSLLANALDIN
jgi:hypothetical protein